MLCECILMQKNPKSTLFFLEYWKTNLSSVFNTLHLKTHERMFFPPHFLFFPRDATTVLFCYNHLQS